MVELLITVYSIFC